jgi:16S rRNA (guanine527-N7)-methyltransferase
MAAMAGASGESAEAIRSICVTLNLDATPAQIDALRRYLDLLQHWNAAYNLTAVRERQAMLSHHLADCLAIVPALRRWQAKALPVQAQLRTQFQAQFQALDVGSGGGLPGVALAVMVPHWEVTCVDAVGKKAAFVRQVAGALPLANLHAEHSRVEAFSGRQFGLITSRAFATLADFVKLSRSCLRPGGVWLAMKGKPPDEEITALPQDIDVFHVEQLSVPGLQAQRCLVWMRLKD